MKSRPWLKILFYLNLAIVLLVIGYKVYLNVSQPQLNVVHMQNIDAITERLEGRKQYRFAVLGNIQNSIGVFEKRLIPTLNQSELDFVVSAGNAVSSGGEDKYRALLGSLSHLDKPYLLTFAENEYEQFGSVHYYDYIGPYFFSFEAGDSRFIFLDTTGKTPWQWQIRWLKDLLTSEDAEHHFLFMGLSPLQPDSDFLLADDDDYLKHDGFRQALLSLLKQYPVDRVFSANEAIFSEQNYHGIPIVVTGGAGGLVLNHEDSFYHYLTVTVDEDGRVGHQVNPVPVGQHPLLRQLESLWLFIYSLFYVGYINFVLIVSALLIVTVKLYQLVFVGKSYYPNYNIDSRPWLDKALNVVMVTNNYLPFIGGVPISIDRLKRGLQQLKTHVLVVAPRYDNESGPSDDEIRVPSLLSVGDNQEFRLANLLWPPLWRGVRCFKPDLIHVHHPFWLGGLGVFLARRLNVPVVYTYHTRLEHYAHFVSLPNALFRNLIAHFLVRRFSNRCESIIVPTASAEQYLRLVGVTRTIYVQPTGIEYDRFQQPHTEEVARLRERYELAGKRVMVTVARLSDEKNLDFMIDAMADIARHYGPDFRLLIIGEGHLRADLEQQIARLNLTRQVLLVGSVKPESMPAWYQLGDLFVFTSMSETQGMVILEAMAAGLPVVTIRSSGIDDVVKDGVNGYKTMANQQLWQQKVLTLMQEDDLRAQLAGQAQNFARDYSVQQFSINVRQIYEETLGRYYARRSQSPTSSTEKG